MGLFKSIKNPLKSVGDLVGGVLNSLTGVSDTAKQSYSDSVKLMNLENANNIALWNMQNAYDTPSAQIARMKDAGIDVNPMTYAVGNGSMSTTASNVATASPHMPSYSSAGNPISNLMNVLLGLGQYERQKQENRILKKDADTYATTGIRPGSDMFSQLARIFTNSPAVDAVSKWIKKKLSDESDEPKGKSWVSPTLSKDILNSGNKKSKNYFNY